MRQTERTIEGQCLVDRREGRYGQREDAEPIVKYPPLFEETELMHAFIRAIGADFPATLG
jgi:hypothetical protein